MLKNYANSFDNLKKKFKTDKLSVETLMIANQRPLRQQGSPYNQSLQNFIASKQFRPNNDDWIFIEKISIYRAASVKLGTLKNHLEETNL